MGSLPRRRSASLRASGGAEVDPVLGRTGRLRLFEMKLSKATRPSRGLHELVRTLTPEQAMVIAPVEAPYEAHAGLWVIPYRRIERLVQRQPQEAP